MANALARKLVSVESPERSERSKTPEKTDGEAKAVPARGRVTARGRMVSGNEVVQIRQLVKWLREIRPLMDKFYKIRGERPRLNKYDVEGLIPSQREAFETVSRNIEDYLEAVCQRPPAEQHGILSKIVKDLNKPVVLTYSQRSIDRASSDANLNLKAAALAAISDIAEVMLVGHANSSDEFCLAMPGNKVRKLHSSKRDAFKTVN